MANNEQLSAFMDGEGFDEDLVTELELDLESQGYWKNYHLIGDIMRGEAPETANWNIAEGVAAALDAEPAHSITSTPLVESQPTPSEARRQLPAWLSQFGQVAVAACVSLAVILGVQQYGAGDSSNSSEQLPVLQTIPLTGSVEPVSLTRDTLSKSNANNEAQILEQRRRVNAMLQDYELQLRLTSEQNVQNNIDTISEVE